MSSKGLVGNFINNFYEYKAKGGTITSARLLNEIEDTFADKNEDRLAEEHLNKLHHTQFKDITTFFAAFDSCALTAGYLQVK